MGRGIIALGLCAACGRSGGLEIRVDPPDPMTQQRIDQIALFVGIGDPTDDTLVPPGSWGSAGSGPRIPVKGQVWALDQLDHLDEVHVDNTSATFLYEPGDPATLAVVVAVGYLDGATVATVSQLDLDVPSNYVALYTLQLEQADAPNLGGMLPDRVEVWQADANAPGPLPTCVHTEDRRTGEVRFVVAADDPDCDGYAIDDASNRECMPKVYMGTRGPQLRETNCVAPTMDPNGNVIGAELAGPSCADGTGFTKTCDESAYCLLPSVASACHNAADTYKCATNINDPQWSIPTPPGFVFCHFPATRDSTSGQLTPCGDTASLLPGTLPAEWGLGGCKSDALIRDETHGWDDHLDFSLATVQLGSVASDCTFSVTLTNPGVAPSASFLFQQSGLLALERGASRGFAVPFTLKLDAVPSCNGFAPYCGFVASGLNVDGNVTSCLTAPPPPSTTPAGI